MISFALCPLQRGYQPQFGNNVLQQALSGGPPRQRVMFYSNPHTVRTSIMLGTQSHQQYFWAFWRLMQRKPQDFLWRLIVDDVEAQTYVCRLDFDSLQVQERDGIVYAVSLTVYCQPKPADLEFDEAILTAWSSGDPTVYINLLEKLVNVDLPQAMRGLN